MFVCRILCFLPRMTNMFVKTQPKCCYKLGLCTLLININNFVCFKLFSYEFRMCLCYVAFIWDQFYEAWTLILGPERGAFDTYGCVEEMEMLLYYVTYT